MSDLNQSDIITGFLDQMIMMKEKKEFKNVTIKKDDIKEIIIPEGMSFAGAIEWLKRRMTEDEQTISVSKHIACYPLDGARALYKAMQKIFGHIMANPVYKGWFSFPPEKKSVRINAKGDTEEIIWGALEPPLFEGGRLETEVTIKNNTLCFSIAGTIKKKFKDVVDEVFVLTEEILKTESIYKGKSIEVDLGYIDEIKNRTFISDIVEIAPEFMDVSSITKDHLIISKVNQDELEGSIFMRIEKMQDCIDSNIRIKHGVLLAGKYGTGKTLAAKVMASVANQYGWTFIYVKKPTHFKNALILAKNYTPAIVFCEDINELVNVDRDEEVTKLMNEIDGITSKDDRIISVFTTNYVEKIYSGFLRPGRIDSLILLDNLDEAAVQRFMKFYATDNKGVNILDPNGDFSKTANSMINIVPAFISDIINKAKTFAIAREGKNIVGKVTPEDIESARISFFKQQELVNKVPEENKIHNAIVTLLTELPKLK